MKSPRSLRAAAILLSTLLLKGAALAASSPLALLSDSVFTSIGSVSHSVRGSSDSSSKTVVGQGTYEVIRVAAVDIDGLHDVTLEALPGQDGAQGQLTLRLPPAAVQQGALAAGQRVQVLQRPFGWELAREDTRRSFFVLLSYEWAREIDAVPVGT